MGSLRLVLDVVFAVGGVAAFGFLAFGAWLVFKHSTGFVPEGQGRFENRHRRRARREPRIGVDKGKLV
ncbi:MAG TPA: hypothetical protein VJM14_05560 [Burkholderiales bacterium]|nr:hypothetical protein [Burkholderiales bacterium]